MFLIYWAIFGQWFYRDDFCRIQKIIRNGVLSPYTKYGNILQLLEYRAIHIADQQLQKFSSYLAWQLFTNLNLFDLI